MKYLSLLFLIVVISCGKNTGKTMYVSSRNGLSLRSEAGVRSTRLGVIPYNNAVKVLEVTGKRIKIGTWGKWTRVTWKGKTGWVFGGFLSANAPDEETKSDPSGLYSEITSGRHLVLNKDGDKFILKYYSNRPHVLSLKTGSQIVLSYEMIHDCVDYFVQRIQKSPNKVILFCKRDRITVERTSTPYILKWEWKRGTPAGSVAYTLNEDHSHKVPKKYENLQN